MTTRQEILQSLRSGAISLDEAERRLKAAAQGAPAREEARALPSRPDVPTKVAAPESDEAPRRRSPIAVVGMSGRYPGAPNLDHFWENLRRGRSSIREVPATRWDVRPYFKPLPVQKGKIYCKWIGMLDEAECFDPLFFNIAPTDAEVMDPQQRIFLEEAYKALEDAGYAGPAANERRCGVYLGIMGNEYLTMLHDRQVDSVNPTSNSFAIAAARLSYFLNLKGPAVAIDTACSSSLVAAHLACQALLTREIDMAVVGGVSLYLSPVSYLGMCAAGMLSPDGQCHTFDEGANGFVPGEGAGALVLKRLEDAESDGDAIHGLIVGSGINQDGRTNGITAPSATSQMALEREVYEACGVDPADLGYVEMHGTGTKLGDPVELEALSTVFKERTAKRRYCAIGSVKTNVGHTSAAAGVASVHKVLLCLRHQEIPPTLNFRTPNPHFDFEDSPFYVAASGSAWEAPPGAPRRAGVSSFGFSGTNAHVVLEEYRPPKARAARGPQGPHLFLLSAKTEERLRLQAERLCAAVEAAQVLDLADLAYTLQVGRDALEHRLAIEASSREELSAGLRSAAEGKPSPGALVGRAKKKADELAVLESEDVEALLRAWIEKKRLSKLARLWLQGVDIDWEKLYGDAKPRRIHLPTYPFARVRCWLPEPRGDSAAAGPASALVHIHPLLHENASDLFEQRYAATFDGTEPFLEDHRVRGRRVMPGAALLEMARAAVAQAWRAPGALRLEGVAFTAPLAVGDQGARVEIRLTPEGSEAVGFEIASRAEGGGSPRVHCRGRALRGAPGAAPTASLDELRASCARRTVSAADCYAAFEAAGIQYGPSHRGIESIAASEGRALASLRLPAGAAADDRLVLHPGLVDSAMQASLGALEERAEMGAAAPASIDEVQIFRSCSAARWAYVCRGVAKGAGELRFDVELLDEAGELCARLSGLAVRALAGEVPASDSPGTKPSTSGVVDGLATLVPVWDAERGLPPCSPRSGARTLVFGAIEGRVAEVQKALEGARIAAAPPEATVEDLTALLERQGPVEHIVWLSPAARGAFSIGDALIEDQGRGVLQLFRLIKAALRAGYGSKPLEWTVVTAAAQRVVATDRVEPAHASVHGLAGTLAKEYPGWRVRLVDVESAGELPMVELLSLPPDSGGRAWAQRGGEWLRRRLALARPVRPQQSLYRRGGVYVVVGGAGGIGEAWSEYLLRTYQAQLVWIGRSPLDGRIRAKLDRLAALGPAPLYLQADAASREAMEGAYQDIKARFERVHGIVHSALALRDQGLAAMDEATFKAGLAAKVDVSVRLAQLFRNDALDFALFFSSAQSFQNAAGQGNYAAGCAFKDAFAHRLAREWPCRVRVVNWGWWGGTGAVASAEYRERMARAGIGSIEPAEAMEALESLLAGPLEQVAFVKTSRPVELEGVDVAEEVEVLPEELRPSLGELSEAKPRGGGGGVAALEARGRAEMDGLLLSLLGAQLASIGADEESVQTGAAGRLVQKGFYRRWLEESAAFLGAGAPGARPFPRGAEAQVAWSEWRARKAEWSEDPNRRAQVRLLEAALEALPDILTGRRLATDVLFPGSSFELVEGIYQRNAVADFMNGALADAVAAHVARRLEREPSAKIRILEIGAGTGGTTAALLARLAPWEANVEEYCFTDLSRAFLARAEETWGRRHHALRTQRFDVEAPPAAQGLSAGAYDAVIAANALHATADIRRALRNAKAAMKRNGLLALSEISRKTLFTHLTVGLLEGWWLYGDPALRIPGCPGLSPESWARVLSQEGFRSVSFPASGTHETGQQVVLAESDGVIRRRAGARRPAAAEPAAAPVGLLERSQATATPMSESGADRAARLERYVQGTILERLSKSLKVSSDALDLEDAFSNYGVDSISGVQLVQALNEALGIELTATDLFDHGSVRRLAAHILSQFEAQAQQWERPAGAERGSEATAAEQAPAPLGPEAVAPAREELRPLLATPQDSDPRAPKGAGPQGEPERRRGPIAVIGMSGRFAGSKDLDELWAHLANGDDLVREVTRWDLSRLYPAGTRFCNRGSFLDDIDCFDPLFFKISAHEARYLDPQQRLFLEEAWKALEDAGCAGAGIAGKACGVYVGCGSGDYEAQFDAEPPPQAFWGNSSSVIPARIAYHLDLQGPAVAVDTACSSSLVAVHLACQALWSGEVELALAGGVFVQTTPKFYRSSQRAGMLSPEGRCHAFDDRADGFVPGEGVGVVVLKRLQDALDDGDAIHGVIRGSGINQDGTTNGITAPSAKSQERLEREVYGAFGIDPGQIQLVEAHGTGTKLGDPIEVDALTRAFRAFTDKRGTCALGSVKTNLGHAAMAAGIAGLLKVLLSLKHRQLPPSLHLRKLNPRVRIEGSPFYVNTALKAWDVGAGEVRRAAVSSFGFSGTNAHAVLEEAPAAARRPFEKPAYLFALSARSAEQLREQARRLAERVERDPGSSLWDVSQTLLLGRRHHDCRLAVVAADRRELVDRLGAWLASGRAPGVLEGDAARAGEDERQALGQRGAQALRRCRGQRTQAEIRQGLAAAAECYAGGGSLPFEELFEGGPRGRAPLPTYPFARERYWARSDGSFASAAAPARPLAEQRLHPLVERNTSTVSEQRFSTRLTEAPFFVGQHRIEGRAILPGVAFLEMARAAGELAAERPVVALEDVAWLKPIAVPGDGIEVVIALAPEEGGALAFEVSSPGVGGRRDLHARGRLILSGEGPRDLGVPLDRTAIEARCPARLRAADLYGRLESLGLNLGPSLRSIRELRVGDREVLAALELPRDLEASKAELLLHPSLLDGSLQAGGALEEGALHIPFALEELAFAGPLPSRAWAHFALSGEGAGRTALVRIVDEAGKVWALMKGFAARPAQVRAAAQANPVRVTTLQLERAFEPADLAAARGAAGPVVVFDRRRAVFDALTGSLGAAKAGALLALASGTPEAGAYALRPEQEGDFDRLFAEVAPAPESLTLAFVGASAPESHKANGERRAQAMGDVREVVLEVLHALRAARRRFPEAKLQVVCLVPQRDGAAAPRWAAAGGLLRTVAKELSRVACKLVELPGDEAGLTADSVRWGAAEVRAGAAGFEEIRYRDGQRERSTWAPRKGLEAAHADPLKARGVYLISGGLGGLGLRVARDWARRAGARLALCGRSALDADKAAALRELEGLGAEALYLQADVSRAEEVDRLVARVKERFGRIDGVVHAAGELRDSLALKKTPEEIDAVLAPKVLGAMFLDEATRDEPLDFFASFSSATAVLGNAGQSDYGYANAFLDAFASQRARLAERKLRSGRSLSIGWPAWREGGMRLDERALEAMRAAAGLSPLESDEGLAALRAILASAEGAVLVLHGERARLEQLVAGRPSEPRDRPRAPWSGERASAAAGAKAVESEIVALAAKIAGLEPRQIAPDKSLTDYGFDSLSFASLAKELSARFGQSLSPALFFEFPTAGRLAAHLCEELGAKLPALAPESAPLAAPDSAPDAAAPSAPPAPKARIPLRRAPGRPGEEAGRARALGEQEPVAIIGMAGVMPQSEDLDEFWSHLAAGHDLITEVPRERWERGGFEAALARSGEAGRALYGGFLKQVDAFDAPFFGISRREAELMDPQQRLFLETVWRAVEDAGYRMSELAGSRTGLFVGASTADYADIVRSSGLPIEGHMATGLVPSVLANRVSYLFDLHGPSEPVDTACSSALIALHRAVQSIASGGCELAIAGGVNALLTPNTFLSFVKAGMLSPDGRCKSFDGRANGYVRGEGAGAVLLKPLSRAVRDRDSIYAVIRASAVNHGGRASSLTAPNMLAQADVLLEAYERAGIDPSTVNYIEAHGTGTALGDPIEVDALKRAFGELFRRRGQAPRAGFCGIGSVKTNAGHLEAAAGVAGLLKVLLSLRHRTLPPSLHFQKLNPYIHLEDSPFYVVHEARPWEPARGADGRELPRRAGVSSFGFGGANAHVVLEEAEAPARAPAEARPQLVVLSAKSEECLRAQAAHLLRRLEQAKGSVDLEALAFTLQAGREPFERRLAICAESEGQLRDSLKGYGEGRVEAPGVFAGGGARSEVVAARVDDGAPSEAAAARALAERKLEKLAAHWVNGASVDFRPLHEGRAPRRIALPTYPFARERYWVDAPKAGAGEPEVAAAARQGESPAEAAGLWRQMLAEAGERKQAVLESYLADQIARMLKLTGGQKLDVKQPLVALGFDSLMALQLRKRVGSQLGLDVSLVKLLGGESTSDLAERILGGGGGANGSGPFNEGVSSSAFEPPLGEVLEGVL